ncbi:P-loop containing nucleoside triphosphate hydrolase protein [Athelia psychrophila]|uniref:P-loop containing nucleoside triphosphate hydrolase protein n=1 Tax=Athelia psychrophila TaxID=1759441 RepID=A0A166X3T7_9AGAM|nr:P-loop containing nucleoside triphosphate hydrolase protein [Fibularhizoctonia sp. CBS 109695]
MSITIPTEKPLAEPTPAEDASSLEASFTIGQYGVWRILTANSSHKVVGESQWKGAVAGLRLLRMFMGDVWRISPTLCLGVASAQIWEGMQTSVALYTSSRLLTSIETSFLKGRPQVRKILTAVAVHIICMGGSAVVRWWSQKANSKLSQKVKYHFGELLFRADIAQDLPTSQEISSKQQASPDDAEQALQQSLSTATLCVSTLSQLAFILQISRKGYGGPLFMGCCLASPFFRTFNGDMLWTTASVIHSNNPHYIRLQALKKLTQGAYRQDVITGNLSGYILDEYTKAQDALGTTSDENPFLQYGHQSTPFRDIFQDLLDTLPMIYYVANAIILPGGFSLSSVAILQQTSLNLQGTFNMLLYYGKVFHDTINDIKKIYDCVDVKNQVQDGTLPYPGVETKGEGMGIEVRGLSFEYAGSKSTKKALDNVSFSIKPGQLVVIVGANGSGKSTLVKLFNRLYTPTAGTILVDGLPMSSYKISDLREASANLSQDHTIYPLTIRENIGLGCPASMSDMDEVRRAAEMGGALGFVEKFQDTFDTTLQPISTAYMGGAMGSADAAMLCEQLLDKRKGSLRESSIPKLLFVAPKITQSSSRTFMRLRSGKIRCCTVDEPSSALDPQGELELFQRLRDAKGGKTMFFVTHRFGHLTKHADVIICMKDGVIAEMGSHSELMSNAAEYANLYNVQAEAFSSNAASTEAKIPEGAV